MKCVYHVSFFYFVLISCSLSARDFLKGTLAWSMDRQSAQFVPDVMITQNMVGNGSFAISSSGTYALAENISFSDPTGFIISASGVTFDLNGHQIVGTDAGQTAIDATGVTEIVVRNGLISGVTTGITFSGVNIGVIDSLQVIGDDPSIFISGSSQIWIKNCLIQTITTNSILITGGSSILVENCIAMNGAAIFLNSGANVTFRECKAIAGTNGFTNLGLHCNIIDCESINCGINGFLNSGSVSIIKNCIAENNTGHGFSNSATDVSVVKCMALGNGGNGIQNSAVHVTVMSCEAHNNSGIGINDASGGTETDVTFFNNLAYDNAVANYSANVPIQASLTTITTGTGFWSNVRNP